VESAGADVLEVAIAIAWNDCRADVQAVLALLGFAVLAVV
jgi:hypothetical protein